MKGDFSHWDLDPRNNVTGILQQQGKVLLDRDWNDQARLNKHWQDQAGRDVVGPDVAAVPSGDPDGFAVTQSAVATGADGVDRVELHVTPGRIWADGIVCYLPGVEPEPAAPVMRVAEYFQPPVQDPASTVASIADSVRDAVICEVSREALNAFQLPDDLLEPALGGPDTTERILTRMAFKLFRLGPGEDCMSIRDQLDDSAARGHLTVRLQPTEEIAGDCPVVLGGGYTGFEHFLYRIEIAALDAGTEPHFKWSQFNGGLVGRGELLDSPNRIRITSNRAAIVNSGLSAFYCEIVAFDEERGTWNVTYGADVTLQDGELHVGTERLGAFAASTNSVFIRLWNGIDAISGFTDTTSPIELLDGIQLVFDAPAGANYTAGDYWTFKVRAGEIVNDEVLISDEPPMGPAYHRVPLAEITWGTSLDTDTSGELEDCRRRFRPLTQLDTCCTYRVGDGLCNHGDFDTIQAAIDALPASGGEVCVLPGVYEENIRIENRSNITISGCGSRSLIRSGPPEGEFALAAPTLLVRGGGGIAIESLAVEGHPTGAGIVLEGADYLDEETDLEGPLIGATLSHLLVLGGQRAAVRASYVENLNICGCNLHQRDEACLEHALEVRGDDVSIVGNTIQVALDEGDLQGVPGGTWSPAPYAGPGEIAPGGIRIKGLSERLRLADNLVRGGSGHGITLGSVRFYDENGEPLPEDPEEGDDKSTDPCEPTREVPPIFVPPIETGGGETTTSILPDGPIDELVIEHNRILDMGICGIGVIYFFDLSALDAFITVRNVAILGNEIRGNMLRPVAEPPAAQVNVAGFGGIALADVENLLVRDNRIGSNGPTHLEAICGVFVLHGEGVDITRNLIVDNGHKSTPSAQGAKRGLRGGIVIGYALAPTRLVSIPGVDEGAPVQNGVPAARIHDNIVAQPLGPALLMTALGPVSVVGNQLTSQGVAPGFTASFIGATVGIMNLGLPNEFYLQYFAFLLLGAPIQEEDPTTAARPGFDDFRFGHALANGNVLFASNQVVMDVFEVGISIAMSSVFILTADDLGFLGNQCDASLIDDVILSQVMLAGLSVRVCNNRLKESAFPRVPNALLSGLTFGKFMNTTTDNESTRCLLAYGDRLVRFPNISLAGGVQESKNSDSPCETAWKIVGKWLAQRAATGSTNPNLATGNLIAHPYSPLFQS